MNYRREIDGLRALAVIPVIFFHAGFQTFSGGFVGVDVFFVISGYLITSLILSEKQAGTFSLIGFYERRARRILPALFFVMFACLPFAWLWLLPADMKSFSQSLVAVSAFSSNVLFYLTSGYFGADAELRPLLHTWSLAVEEQYYVLFPIFLLLTWRLGARWIIAILAAIAIISLAAAQWGSITHPSFTFFLLPTRGWEILIGAFAAFYLFDNDEGTATSEKLGQALGVIGLLLITYAVFAFDRQTPFPSLYALIPTIGTAFVILFATQQTLAGKLLGSKPLVGIGLISYSAYLWHQPLFAFARHKSLYEPSKVLLGTLAVTAVVLAFLSWKFVETPFRNRQRINRNQVWLWGALCSVLFVVIGLIGHVTNGIPQRYSDEQQVLLTLADRDYKQTLESYGLGKCFIDYEQTFEVLLKENCVTKRSSTQRVIVFGDSAAAHWMVGVRREFEKIGYGVEQWTGTSCRAVQYSKNSKRCNDFYVYFVNEIIPSLTKSDLIVVSSRWIGTYQEIGREEFLSATDHLFQSLKSTGVNVIVIGNTPEFGKSPHQIMVREKIANRGSVFLRSADFGETNVLLKSQAEKYGYAFFNPIDVLCDSVDVLSCMVSKDGVFYFLDRGHLSIEGSVFLVKHLIDKLGQSRTGADSRSMARP